MYSNKNKVFSALVILILVVGILFGGGYVYFKYNTLIPTPKPTFSTGIYGKVISDSDVQTVPDTPIQNALIFIYPREEFDRYYMISNGEVDDRVGYKDTTPVFTDSFGNYAITLNPGQYALCFTTELIEEHKHRILDCVDIEVIENELRKVNISRQFDTQFSCINENECRIIDLSQIRNQDWETFTNVFQEYTFQYPTKLTISQNEDSVTLSHSIPYENTGDCDMEGGTTNYPRLEDFSLEFNIIKGEKTSEYYDGTYTAGVLNGKWFYEGAEGCGHLVYYFPTSDGNTLVVRRAAVQALSGISSTWAKEEILQVPGVISPETSENIFKRILSSFRFTN